MRGEGLEPPDPVIIEFSVVELRAFTEIFQVGGLV
jgi:hypothetical protein